MGEGSARRPPVRGRCQLCSFRNRTTALLRLGARLLAQGHA
jgi:hypothetical protein